MNDGPRGLTIEVEHLAKHYGEVRAVDDISFTAREGEILGFLGHNGAGKTTTIRMLTGRARPTSGRARVVGHDVVHERERMKPLINLVFEDQNLYPRLSGRENLQLFAELYGVPRARVDELLEAVRARRGRRTQGQDLLQRHEAAPAGGARAAQPAARPVPRRADARPRPDLGARGARDGARAGRGRGPPSF